jgi:hypothetical protein
VTAPVVWPVARRRTSISDSSTQTSPTRADLRRLGLCLAAELIGHTREDALYVVGYVRNIVEDYCDPDQRGEQDEAGLAEAS